MANIKPAEVSEILRQQLKGIQIGAELEEVGTVLQVGDGIARIYGLSNACLLYTSEADDELHCVDLGSRRIINKKRC